MEAEGATACRGIRGAITVEGHGPGAVEEATAELLRAVEEENGCRPEEVASAIFTVSEDLPGANPAGAARAHGWSEVPFLVVREHGGDTSVGRCIRVLVLWNTALPQAEVRHVYLRGARVLRPDLELRR